MNLKLYFVGDGHQPLRSCFHRRPRQVRPFSTPFNLRRHLQLQQAALPGLQNGVPGLASRAADVPAQARQDRFKHSNASARVDATVSGLFYQTADSSKTTGQAPCLIPSTHNCLLLN